MVLVALHISKLNPNAPLAMKITGAASQRSLHTSPFSPLRRKGNEIHGLDLLGAEPADNPTLRILASLPKPKTQNPNTISHVDQNATPTHLLNPLHVTSAVINAAAPDMTINAYGLSSRCDCNCSHVHKTRQHKSPNGMITTYIHTKQPRNKRTHPNPHRPNRDFQIKRQQRVPVRIQNQLHNLLCRLHITLHKTIDALAINRYTVKNIMLTEIVSASFTISSTCFAKDSRRTSRSS